MNLTVPLFMEWCGHGGKNMQPLYYDISGNIVNRSIHGVEARQTSKGLTIELRFMLRGI